MNNTLALAAMLTLFWAKPAGPPSVGSISLEDLTRYSEAVFVGQVEEIFPVEQTEAGEGQFSSSVDYPATLKVARVRVEQALKGVVQDSRVHFLAMSTWTCDISTAEVGERALYFLKSSEWTSKLADSTRAGLKQRTSGGPVYKLAHAGRGRMPLRKVDGVEYATYWSNVRLPQQLPVVAGPEPEYSFIRSVHLGAIAKELASYVAAQQPYFELTHRQSGSSARGWKFRLWSDGYGTLNIDGSSARDIVETVPAKTMAGLSDRLKASQISDHRITIGPEVSDGSRRTLIVRGKDQLMHVKIEFVDPDLTQGNTIKANVTDILNLWSAIRALFDEPNLLDARETDRRWIESR